MFNRRACIKTLSAAIVGGAIQEKLGADLACSPPMAPYGVQACQAGIPTEKMDDVYATQKADEWCWAACIEMVFTYWGHPVDQQEIVKRTWGSVVDMPAQPSQIIRALNRSWTDSDGGHFQVSGDVYSASGATAAQDLARDMPLIICSLGHAMVLTAIFYNRAPSSQGQVTGAVVRDPWPGRGRRELGALEAAATMLLARVRVR